MSRHEERYENINWVLSALSEMIDETVYYADTFSHALKAHNNDRAANVFFLASEQFKTEKEIVTKHAKDYDLPAIPPWEVSFPGYQHPSSHLTETHYLMTEIEAREAVERLVAVHRAFYEYLLKGEGADEVARCVDLLLKHHEQWS